MPGDRPQPLHEILMSIASCLYWAMDEADYFRPGWRGEAPVLASQMERILDEALPRAS
jgi:hypothetical protein